MPRLRWMLHRLRSPARLGERVHQVSHRWDDPERGHRDSHKPRSSARARGGPGEGWMHGRPAALPTSTVSASQLGLATGPTGRTGCSPASTALRRCDRPPLQDTVAELRLRGWARNRHGSDSHDRCAGGGDPTGTSARRGMDIHHDRTPQCRGTHREGPRRQRTRHNRCFSHVITHEPSLVSTATRSVMQYPEAEAPRQH